MQKASKAQKVEPEFPTRVAQLFEEVNEILDAENPDGSILTFDEFLEHEVSLGIDLAPVQMLVPKVLYGLPLTTEEVSMLEYFKAVGRTTWDNKEPTRHQVLCLEAGRRSGKTLTASLIGAYEFYKLCKRPNPQEYFNIAWSTPINILVIATSASQGKRTIFSNLKGVLENSPYFQMLVRQGKLFIGQEEIRYDDKRLAIFCGNSQSSGQVGGTVIAFIMDEVARFKDDAGENNGLKLWKNLGISTASFGKEAIRIAISSAWEKGDAIEQLYDMGAKDPNSIGFRFRSWDMNPVHASRTNPVIAYDYNTDPVSAALEYEGIRPEIAAAFFEAEEIHRAFRGKSCLDVKPKDLDHENCSLRGLTLLNFAKNKKHPTFLHFDSSIKKDGYAMAFGHPTFDSDDNVDVVIDGLLVWEPEPGRPVSFADTFEKILLIRDKVDLRLVTTDHYAASAETIQKLTLQGVKAETLFFSNAFQKKVYTAGRQLLHADRLIIPESSLFSPLAKRELLRVQLGANQKIQHPKGVNETKDLADCIMMVAYNILSQYKSLRSLNIVPTVSSFRPGHSSQASPSLTSKGVESSLTSQYLQAMGSNRQNYLGHLRNKSAHL